MLSGYAFSYLTSNGSRLIYKEQDTGAEYDIRKSFIEPYVELEGPYFFDAYSDYMNFSKSFELQDQKGIDFTEWQTHVYSALINIRKAKTTYSLLIKEVEVTPYNWRVVYKLWLFNYHEFRQKKVECGYLWEGQILPGLRRCNRSLQEELQRSGELEQKLNKIMGLLYAKEKPVLEDLWDLNDTFAHTVTFC